jgi:hypothetical protein
VSAPGDSKANRGPQPRTSVLGERSESAADQVLSSVPQEGAVESLSHAPPGPIEGVGFTGRPGKGGLSISAPDCGLEKYSIGDPISVLGKPAEVSYPILDESNTVAGYARIAMRRGSTAEVRWIMPVLSRSGAKITLGVAGIRALQSRFKLDHPNVRSLQGLEYGRYYRKTFFRAFPQTEGKVWVHHAIEKQVLKYYTGLFTEEEIHSLENLRGIPKSVNHKLHLSKTRKAWNKFYDDYSRDVATREQFLKKAAEIDSFVWVTF